MDPEQIWAELHFNPLSHPPPTVQGQLTEPIQQVVVVVVALTASLLPDELLTEALLDELAGALLLLLLLLVDPKKLELVLLVTYTDTSAAGPTFDPGYGGFVQGSSTHTCNLLVLKNLQTPVLVGLA